MEQLELKNMISAEMRKLVGMEPDATDVELHQRLTEANEDLKADVIVGMVNQIQSLFAEEVQKKVDAFTSELKAETESVISMLGERLEALEKKQTEIESAVNASIERLDAMQSADVSAEVEKLREEFGAQLLAIKSAQPVSKMIDGDGQVFKHVVTQENPPKVSKWSIY